MKIAVATDDKINVCGHVGKCRGFLIFNVENGKILTKEFKENLFTDHVLGNHESGGQRHGRGSGHGNNDGHKRLAEGLKDCEYLISLGMGWRLVEDLKSLGIEPIVTVENSAEEAALRAERGELKHVDDGICR